MIGIEASKPVDRQIENIQGTVIMVMLYVHRVCSLATGKYHTLIFDITVAVCCYMNNRNNQCYFVLGIQNGSKSI